MNCQSCDQEVVDDRIFCPSCKAFSSNSKIGLEASLIRRFVAQLIDPFLAVMAYVFLSLVVSMIIGAIVGKLSENGIRIMDVLVLASYGVWFLWALSKGRTPGKWLLRERVVNATNGEYPGLWRMILRELIGKVLSGLALGLGYILALFDKNHQGWHDKLSGTVVIRVVSKDSNDTIAL